MNPPASWAMLAACASQDPDVWFAADLAIVIAAKAVCAACPVRAECLAEALDRGETEGIWGGLTAEERAQLLAGRRAVA